MSLPNETPLQKLQFYVTAPYSCGYLPKKLAQSLIASPQHLVTAPVYSNLIRQGFRRSGKFAYRPHCEHCQACVPVRLAVAAFVASRSQKRAYKQHQHLQARVLPVGFEPAHFALYHAYQQARHADSIKHEIDDLETAAEQYRSFLAQSQVDSVMVEFRDEHQVLKMVSVIDKVEDGLSAVYTFYETTDPKTSYGTYNILWQIKWAKSLKLDHLYLGYWIENSQKMAYKQSFKPQQHLIAGKWQAA